MFSIKKTRNTSGLSKNYDLAPAIARHRTIAVNTICFLFVEISCKAAEISCSFANNFKT